MYRAMTDEQNKRAADLMIAADAAQVVTYKDFGKVMQRRNHDADDLVQRFRGKVDDPRDLFERVMSCRWKDPKTGRYENRSETVIAYRSVIEFYRQELHFFKETAKTSQRYCLCGCGSPVFGQYKFAREACRKRLQRQRGQGHAIFGAQVIDFVTEESGHF
jgi:hypothetical protein